MFIPPTTTHKVGILIYTVIENPFVNVAPLLFSLTLLVHKLDIGTLLAHLLPEL